MKDQSVGKSCHHEKKSFKESDQKKTKESKKEKHVEN